MRLLREGAIEESLLPALPKKRVFTRLQHRLTQVLPMRKKSDAASPEGIKPCSPAPAGEGETAPPPTSPGPSPLSSPTSSPTGKGDVPGQKPRLEQLSEYVTTLFSLPRALLHSSAQVKSFFELPVDPPDQTAPDGDSSTEDGDTYERLLSGTFATSMALESHLLDSDMAHTLRSYLGVYNMGPYQLCFSTYRDGWSLDTLYALTAHRNPCILLLRSLESHALVGAFLPEPISPPSPTVRGDGHTFVFRLDGTHAGCFKWENISYNQDDRYGSAGFDTSLMQAHMQFAMCTMDHIAVGASSVHGTNALRIDADLQRCISGTTDTFNNPPLVPEEPNQPFSIGKALIVTICLSIIILALLLQRTLRCFVEYSEYSLVSDADDVVFFDFKFIYSSLYILSISTNVNAQTHHDVKRMINISWFS